MSQHKNIIYRKGILSDCEAIHGLIQTYAKDGKMLPRSLQYIVEHIRDFWVATENESVIGACAFTLSQKDLAEIKSLTVDNHSHHLGIATTLIKNGIEELKTFGVSKVFCLTYVPEFFGKLEFHEVPKETLPHKIWTECVHCPSFPDCGEIAMTRDI